MTRPAIGVADIVRRKGRQLLQRLRATLSYQQLKACRAVKRCRTAALGGHRDKCEDCTFEAPFSYNSCRSRCCPKCQAQARKRWLKIQQRDLLNTNYFHVVFTLPRELNPLALTSRRPLVDLLFDASFQTLLEVAADPKRLGAEIGFLSILHTWGSNLLAPLPYSLRRSGRRTVARSSALDPTSHPMFLFRFLPCASSSARSSSLAFTISYRRDLLNLRGSAASFRDPAQFEQLDQQTGQEEMVRRPQAALRRHPNMSCASRRYTHRMAISNHRITAFDGERVSFRWRDYAHGGKQRVMTLDAVSFLCRFFLHVLPKGFVRIRRYGLSNRFRKQLLPLARTLLAEQAREPLLPPPLPDCAPWHCPRCGKAMRVVQRFTAAELYFAGFDTSDPLVNTPRRLAHCTSPRAVCAPRSEQLHGNAQSHSQIPLSQIALRRLTLVHHQRRNTGPQNHAPQVQMLFNLHNPSQHHRDRNACGFLLTSLIKTPRNHISPSSKPSCARRFRCRLAVTHPEPNPAILKGAG